MPKKFLGDPGGKSRSSYYRGETVYHHNTTALPPLYSNSAHWDAELIVVYHSRNTIRRTLLGCTVYHGLFSEVSPRRFQLENMTHNITLESSGRLGHRLVTEAFRIFLKEVLGYESVDVVVVEDHFNATHALRRLATNKWGVPER